MGFIWFSDKSVVFITSKPDPLNSASRAGRKDLLEDYNSKSDREILKLEIAAVGVKHL